MCCCRRALASCSDQYITYYINLPFAQAARGRQVHTDHPEHCMAFPCNISHCSTPLEDWLMTWPMQRPVPGTMRCGDTPKVFAKRMLEYYPKSLLVPGMLCDVALGRKHTNLAATVGGWRQACHCRPGLQWPWACASPPRVDHLMEALEGLLVAGLDLPWPLHSHFCQHRLWIYPLQPDKPHHQDEAACSLGAKFQVSQALDLLGTLTSITMPAGSAMASLSLAEPLPAVLC